MWFIVLVALIAPSAVACSKGCYEYEGNCACDARPVTEETAYAQPSDEKPSRHPEPAWQRGEVNASTGQEERDLVYKRDQAKIKADQEGKRAAGIN